MKLITNAVYTMILRRKQRIGRILGMLGKKNVDDSGLCYATFQEELKDVLTTWILWEVSLQISKGSFKKIMIKFYRPILQQRLFYSSVKSVNISLKISLNSANDPRA